MKFEQLSEKEIENIYPNNIIKTIEEMKEEDKEIYLLKYSLYRKLFTEYMIQKLNLKEYDEELKNSELEFIPNNKEDMDIYQYFSSKELRYFYIRNNIYIENLNKEEESFLQQKIDNKNYDLDEESKKMIEETYQKVIFEDILKHGEKCIINYGPDSSSFMASNDAIVIGVRYDEFVENGLDDNEWQELYEKQLLYLGALRDRMYVKLKGDLQVPLAILKYNEYSVRKM